VTFTAEALALCTDGVVANCTIVGTGCPGTKECVGGYWTSCLATGGETTISCTNTCMGTDRTGFVVCNKAGQRTGCKVASTESCNGCDDDGDGVVDNARGSTVPNTLTRPYANPNHCTQNGTQTCLAGAVWSAPSGCGGTGDSCTTACNVTVARTCDSACNVPSTCTSPEICNNCDDDGNGLIDDGLNCSPCNLSTRLDTATLAALPPEQFAAAFYDLSHCGGG
jgi:hypothetical protein